MLLTKLSVFAVSFFQLHPIAYQLVKLPHGNYHCFQWMWVESFWVRVGEYLQKWNGCI